VTAFFNECYHLADWLIEDPSLSLSADEVWTYMQTEPLATVDAICNTSKHHTRRSRSKKTPPGSTARIRGGAYGVRVARVTIELHFGTPNRQSFDALQLAQEAVQSWRDFLKAHDIQEPT
jgi:hypothetical protein